MHQHIHDPHDGEHAAQNGADAHQEAQEAASLLLEDRVDGRHLVVEVDARQAPAAARREMTHVLRDRVLVALNLWFPGIQGPVLSGHHLHRTAQNNTGITIQYEIIFITTSLY